MKTLEDFKQQVAEKYGFKRYNDLIFFSANDVDSNIPDEEVLHDEIAELYAAYRETEGYKAYKKQANEMINSLIARNAEARKEGWNEALEYSAERVGPVARKIILKGLKP